MNGGGVGGRCRVRDKVEGSEQLTGREMGTGRARGKGILEVCRGDKKRAVGRRTETVDCGEATDKEEDGEDEEDIGDAVQV